MEDPNFINLEPHYVFGFFHKIDMDYTTLDPSSLGIIFPPNQFMELFFYY